MAVWPPRNPGSSFKIFTYTAAIQSGRYTMVAPVQDSPLKVTLPSGSVPPTYEPKNYDKRWHGTCQVQQCLGNSLNVPAVKVEIGTGVPNVVQVARNLGAPPWQSHANGSFTNDDPADSFGYSLTLGGYGETPLQMATGASVLAAQGVLHQPYGVAKVLRKDGSKLFEAKPEGEGKNVLDPKVAFIMSQMMSDDDNRAMIFGRGSPLTLSGRRVAAKTGTTDSFTDGWTVGFTPSLVTAVWMGNPDYSQMADQSDGVVVAAPAWHAFMQGALDQMGKGSEWFSEPAGLTHTTVNGKLAWFLPGTNPYTQAPRLPTGWEQSAPQAPPSKPPPGQGNQGGHGPPSQEGD
jgi:membrane peptidoglycan carboxypeptidase